MSPRRVARVLAALGAVVLLTVVIMTTWVIHRRDTKPSLKDIAGLVPDAFVRAQKFQWTQIKAGRTQWKLNARDATYSGDRSSVTLTDAHIQSKSEDGKEVSVAAPRAVIFLDGTDVKRAQLSGGATIRYGDFELVTDNASFSPLTNDVDAPGVVTLTGNGVKITGVGLVGNAKSRQFELRQEVTTDIERIEAPKTALPG
ncbi:MAG: LPS export ABC transporter periplasmic protein LptC [Candidatus Binataceae bacterium]